MGNKRILLIFAMLMAVFTVCAEDTQDVSEKVELADDTGLKNYFIRETEEGAVFIQRLSWDAVSDISGFEAELEALDENTKVWKQIDVRILETNYMDVSLSPGKYRYRVRIINLLSQKERPSAYRDFVVHFAYQPEIYSVSPSIINFEELQDHTITVTGENLHKDTRFILQNTLGTSTLYGNLVELNEQGTKATIAFDFTRMNPAHYILTAVDPSDLTAKSRDIVFRFQKSVDVYLSGGYTFTAFAGNKVLKEYFGKDFALLGGGLRLRVLPVKRFYGCFGFNITASAINLYTKTPIYTLKSGMIFTQLNASYIYSIIKRRLVFDAHAGMGSSFLMNLEFSYNDVAIKSPKYWYWGLTANAGTALYVYVYKRLYIEFNLDHIIPIRQGKGFPKYVVQPQIAVGWEF